MKNCKGWRKHLTLVMGTACGLAASLAVATCQNTGLQLQILGSGGPGAASGRASSAYMVWTDGVGRILVDAGSGSKNTFHQSAADLGAIELVALSHLHPDHAAELPAILWPAGGTFDLSGPGAGGGFPAVDEFLERLLGSAGAFPVLTDRVNANPIIIDARSATASAVWNRHGISVRGLGVPHADVPTIAYRIEFANHSVVFTSDQNGSDPRFISFIQDADVLVIHLAAPEDAVGVIADLHAKPSVWGEMAEAGNVGRVVVSHISTSSPQVLADSLAILQANYSGAVTVGEDLLCVDVN